MAPRLQAFLAIVFWGISFVATRLALREVSPVTLIFMRCALGVAFLHAVLALRRIPLIPPRSTWPTLAGMGFIGIFFHQMIQSSALTMTTAVRTGWLIGITPIWSALLAAIVLRERFGPGKIIGLVLGFLGAALVVTRGRIEPGLLALPSTRGDLLILASTLNWAVYTVLGRGTMRTLGSLRMTAGVMLVGGILIAVWFVGAGGWKELAHLSSTAWGALLFLGVGCSGLAYWFWYGALERIETSSVASFLYLEPLVTVAAAVPILGEQVGWSTLVGGLVVMSGVALVQRSGEGRLMAPRRRSTLRVPGALDLMGYSPTDNPSRSEVAASSKKSAKTFRKAVTRLGTGARAANSRKAPTDSSVVRIVVADKLPLDRRSLASLLQTQPDFAVVGEAESAQVAADLCARLKPSILLIALRIGAHSGRTPIVDIRAAAPSTPILALAERGEGECVVLNPPGSGRNQGNATHPVCTHGTDCLQIAVAEGASGTIRRSAEPEVFFHAIRTVASGSPWYEAGTATAIMRHALAPHQEVSNTLSLRELDVAGLISVGRSNKEIAQALEISEPTVKKHVGHILEKLGLQDRLQVGLFVARNPLVLQPNGARRRS